MAKKKAGKRKKAAKRKAGKRKAAKRKSALPSCKLVNVCGKRRRICRDKKGRIKSNRPA
jgi:hypothetical protein